MLVLNKIKNFRKSVILNCGYGKGISVLEAIREFEKQTKKKFKINFKNRRKGDMEEIIADASNIKKFLNGNQKKIILIVLLKVVLNGKKNLNNTKNILNFFQLIFT